MEGALKMIRSHGNSVGGGKTEIIALENSFHGRTLGAISITGQPKYRKDFEPLLPGARFVPRNDVAPSKRPSARRQQVSFSSSSKAKAASTRFRKSSRVKPRNSPRSITLWSSLTKFNVEWAVPALISLTNCLIRCCCPIL